jgi:hypothetical protein
LQGQIEALGPWFHNLHLPGGVQTAPHHFIGGDFPRFKWLEIAPHIPQDLRGWRVLDVGCNAGFYSFELARRGASVLAIDVEDLYLTQARWAAGVLGLQDQVEFRRMGVYEVARLQESFDLVWFMGVFYHLRYPLLALDLLARRTRRLMMFQTLTMPGEPSTPTRTTTPSPSASRCWTPAGPRWHSSSTASPATRATGGCPTTPAARRCCAPPGCAWRRAPPGKSTCASPTPTRRASRRTTSSSTRRWARCARCPAQNRRDESSRPRRLRRPLPPALRSPPRVGARGARAGAALHGGRAPRLPRPLAREPLPWQQRVQWLQDALTPDERERVSIVPLREHWDEERLVRQVQAAVGTQHRPVAWVTGAPPVDALDLPPGWSFAAPPGADPDAALVPWLHALYASDDPAPVLAQPPSPLPAKVAADLAAWTTQPSFATIRDDWRQIAHERRQWSVAPYPVVLATVDAVVQAGGHVLLIRRGRSPGKGLWALPGGFLEPAKPCCMPLCANWWKKPACRCRCATCAWRCAASTSSTTPSAASVAASSPRLSTSTWATSRPPGARRRRRGFGAMGAAGAVARAGDAAARRPLPHAGCVLGADERSLKGRLRGNRPRRTQRFREGREKTA